MTPELEAAIEWARNYKGDASAWVSFLFTRVERYGPQHTAAKWLVRMHEAVLDWERR